MESTRLYYKEKCRREEGKADQKELDRAIQ